ncbi:MAG: glycosyltransferase family 4 protein [Desulfovibrionaceae bacterium]
MLKIAFLIGKLSCGGAERVVCRLANAMSARGDEVTIMTLDSAPPYYEVSSKVSRIPLGVYGKSDTYAEASANFIKRVLLVRRGVRAIKPDVLFSFIDETNVLASLAVIGTGVPVGVCIRNDPWHYDMSLFWRLMRRLAYPLADCMVTQTDDAKSFYEGTVKNIFVIPNPVAPWASVCTKPHRYPRPTLLAIGKLHRQKGHDLLLQAFAAITEKYADWDLFILGDGEERRALERQVAALGLERKVSMPGMVPDVTPYLLGADCFVMASRFEGFSNALCEAMATGLPLVASDCQGNKDIVTHDKDGLVVPVGDVAALTHALDTLLGDEALRCRLGAQARSIVDRFSFPVVLGLWDEVIASVTH